MNLKKRSAWELIEEQEIDQNQPSLIMRELILIFNHSPSLLSKEKIRAA
jgi:hypothetical protein